MSTLEPWLAPPPEPRQKNSTWHRAISLPADDRVSRCVSSLCSWFYGLLWPYGPGSRSARMHETRPRRPEVGIGARDALVEPGAHVRQASVGVPARRGPVCSVLGVELEGRPVPEGLSNACCRARSARSTESSRWIPAAAQPGGARADTNTNVPVCGSGDQGMWPQRWMLPRQGHFPRRSSLGWSQATDTGCTAASRSEPSTAARTLFVAAAQTHDRPSHRKHVIDIIKRPTSGQNRRTPDHRLRRKADTNDQRILHNAE